MLGTGITLSSALRHAPVAQVDQTQVDVFTNLYEVFLVLGTIVGVLVIAYTVYNAYKYRETGGDGDGRYDIDEDALDGDDYDVARPRRGEIPTGQGKGGGKKLFMSFSISAVLVLGLIIYSYSLLLYVEGTATLDEQNDAIEDLQVEVTGFQFGWAYDYPNGLHSDDYESPDNSDEFSVGGETNITYQNDIPDSEDDALVVPKGHQVNLAVTSSDTFHNYGIPEFRAKTDAMPEYTTTTWFQADQTGKFYANCYELCGQGHSNMKGDVVVLEPEDFVLWYSQYDAANDLSDLEFIEGDIDDILSEFADRAGADEIDLEEIERVEGDN